MSINVDTLHGHGAEIDTEDTGAVNDTPRPAPAAEEDDQGHYLSIPQDVALIGLGAAMGGAVGGVVGAGVGAAAGLAVVGSTTAAYYAGYYAGSSQPKIAPGT
jgi:hypothetical protein